MSVSTAKSSAKKRTTTSTKSTAVKRFKIGACQVWINSEERSGSDGPYQYVSSKLGYSFWNSKDQKYVNLTMYLPLDELLNMSTLCSQAYADSKLSKSDVHVKDDRSANQTENKNEVVPSGIPDDAIMENDA